MTEPRDARRDAISERDAANVADPSRCDAPLCGAPVGPRRDGETRYCSDACKSRAYRERQGGAS